MGPNKKKTINQINNMQFLLLWFQNFFVAYIFKINSASHTLKNINFAILSRNVYRLVTKTRDAPVIEITDSTFQYITLLMTDVLNIYIVG